LGDITCNLPLRDKGNNIVKIKVSQNDKPYSKICSYSKDCEYDCIDNNNKPNDIKNMDTLDVSQFKPVLYGLCEYIKQLYINNLSYTMEEIIDNLRKIGIKCEDRVIYLSMRIMTNEKNKYTIIKNNDNYGYLNYIGNQYIFKPLDIKDTKLPIVYRYSNLQKVDEYIDTGKKQRIRTKKKIIVNKTDIETILINIDKLKIYFNRELNDKKFIYNIDEKYLKDYILDRLTINDKEIFLKILIQKIDKGEYSSEGEEKYVFEHFQRNLIYKGSDIGEEDSEYVFDIIKPESIKPIGYYLYDGTTFIYYLLIDGEIKKLDKDDEKSDDIKKWLQIYSQRPEYYKRYKEYIQGKIWGYIFNNTKKQYIFKLVDKNANALPGFRAKGHRDCNGQQTGDLSRNILKSLDQETDKEYINKEIDNTLYSKSGLSRSIACIYLELVMREMKLIYNYDNVILMKI